MKPNHRIAIIVLLLAVVTSCIKDKFNDFNKTKFDFDWEPNWALPVAHGHLTIHDLLPDNSGSILNHDTVNHCLYILYNSTVFSLPASQIITIPDQQLGGAFLGGEFIAQGFPTTTPVTVSHGGVNPFAGEMTMDNIDSLVFKSGDFVLNTTSTFLHKGTITITFPTLTKNGQPYTKVIDVNTDDGTYTNQAVYSDLAGYHFNLSNPAFNEMPIAAEMTLYESPGHTIDVSDMVTIGITFANIKYSILWGALGQRNIPIDPDTVEINFFNSNVGGQVYFEDPKIRLKTFNSFGLNLAAGFDDFHVYSASTGTFNPYPFPFTSQHPVSVHAALIPGQSTDEIITLDKNNYDSISNIIRDLPRYLTLNPVVATNPNEPNAYNFVTDTSKLRVDLEMDLPIWGWLKVWLLQDTLDFDMSKMYKDSSVDLSSLEWIKFRFNIINGMPFDISIQATLVDSNYNFLADIISSSNAQIMTSATVNSNGEVIAPAPPKTTEITYQGSNLATLRNAKKILLKGILNAGSEHPLKLMRIWDTNYIDVKLGVQVQGKIHVGTDM